MSKPLTFKFSCSGQSERLYVGQASCKRCGFKWNGIRQSGMRKADCPRCGSGHTGWEITGSI
ncbi:hypothetical protein SAMN05660284_00670 [Formivibrio citricus]|uniref:Uncharacterized protein n=1 Tax=Formivibrio citricus TaxID=83765 RepID=A0A1I4WKJ7_9NEIS|nr:hypothetical protein SAMN05660284_00670 [Formivibrio citricus]